MSDRLSTQTINRSSSAPTRKPIMGWRDLPPIAPDVADANRIFLFPDPTIKPSDLYEVQLNNCTLPGNRFVRSTNPAEMLIFVDGSSLNNGTPNARAGYGVVFAPLEWYSPISGRLEQDGNPQTSNRAELRAVLVSLTLRFWAGEGFSRIVLACDSEYVVKGISEWIFKWRMNGWKTSAGRPVVNQDLWNKLEEKLREMEKEGMLVQFWKIPREWNEADKYAKAGAVIILLFPFFIFLNEVFFYSFYL
jgi:ribonuclease HI